MRATLSDLVTISNPLDYHIFIWDQRASACARPSPRSWPAAGTSPASSSTSRAPTGAATPTGRSRSPPGSRRATRPAAGRPCWRPARLPAGERGRGADRGRHRAAARHRRGARRRRGRGRHRRGAGRHRCPRRLLPAAELRRRAAVDAATNGRASASSRRTACRIPAARSVPTRRGRRSQRRGARLPGRGEGGRRRARRTRASSVRCALDLRDAGAVGPRPRRMAQLGEALLVEPMVTDGVAELIVGHRPRPAGRPVPRSGLPAACWSSCWRDRALLLLPTTAGRGRAALLRL